MSKITQYLNEHILGEISSSDATRKRFSRDGSLLTMMPEIVVHPRVTNDIRKVARFTWQLAEKGHVIPITVRGGGSDQTGAAIGKGIIINTIAHLNKVFFINPKHKEQSVHTQPGVTFKNLNDTLESHGLIIPTSPTSSAYSTIGGAVANNAGGVLSGKFGLTGDYVSRLEVVLANGDLIETSRINRRELDKKKGLQTLEGEIYRKIDGIIEDNQQIIDSIEKDNPDNTGYSGISKVKDKDGSFDLTPLFIGSQGTLGIISEIVLKSELFSDQDFVVVASFSDAKLARDTADIIAKIEPTTLDLLDGRLFNIAKNSGKKYPLIDEKECEALLYISLKDENNGQRKRKIKKTLKALSNINADITTSDETPTEELQIIREVSSVVFQSDKPGESTPSLIDSSSVPTIRLEEFLYSLKELEQKHHIELPVHINWLNGVIHTRPNLKLNNVGDKQKTLKLIDDYVGLISRFDGSFAAESGEGRLKSTAIYNQIDQNVVEVYEQIRLAFDPFGTLNPGVKQNNDYKTLIQALDSDFSFADIAEYSPQI